MLLSVLFSLAFIFHLSESQCSPKPPRTSDNLIPTNPGVSSVPNGVPSQSQQISFANNWEWHVDDVSGYGLTTTANSVTMTKTAADGWRNDQAWNGMFFPTSANTQNLFPVWHTHSGATIYHKVSLKFSQASTNKLEATNGLPTVEIVVFVWSKSKLATYQTLPGPFPFPTAPGSKWPAVEPFGFCRDETPQNCITPTLTPTLKAGNPAGVSLHTNVDNLPVGVSLGKTTATTPTKFEATFKVDASCTDCFLGIMVVQPNQGLWSGTSWTISDVVFQRLGSSLPSLQGSTSEFVQLFKMAPLSTVEAAGWPRSNCPHQQSGLKNWDDPATWGGSVPSSGSSARIIVPANTKVLIRSCSLSSSWASPYSRIYIPSGSELIFDDQDIDIYVQEIFVMSGGKLSVGGPNCRLYSKIRFFFSGSRATSSVAHSDASKPSKGLISEGETNILGKQYHPTWTRLARGANAQDTILYLQDEVNWEVGQEIVITTTKWYDRPNDHENERVTITGVHSSRKIVSINKALVFPHFVGPEYQAEVILLSRRIRFEGSDSGDKYGGHTEIRGQSVGRFAGVEAVRMGQQNVLARYPIHWHLNQVSATSLVEDCSMHESYWRCVTIHGTDKVSILRNIGFNISGHCYYLEDGVEEQNVFKYNAAVHVNPIAHIAAGPGTGQEICSGCPQSWLNGKQNAYIFSKDELVLPADVAASGFYISNAYNTFIGNIASGGWAGFAFINMPKPIGVFSSLDKGYKNPFYRPTLEFNGNTAHSSGSYWGKFGACIYAGGNLAYENGFLVYNTGRSFPSHPTALSATQDAFMRLNNTKVYLCALGIQHWGERSGYSAFESHDVIRGIFVTGQNYIDHALFNGRSANTRGAAKIYDRNGFMFYDTFIRQFLNDVTFRNFLGDDPIIKFLTFSSRFLPQGVAAVNNIRFENCPNAKSYRMFLGWCGPLCAVRDRSGDNRQTQASRLMATYDLDGTTCGTNRSTLIGATRLWWNYRRDCTYDEFEFMWYCPYDGKNELAYLDVDVPGVTTGRSNIARGLEYADTWYPDFVGYVSQFGARNYSVPMGAFPGIAGPTATGWYYRPTGGAPKTFSIGKWGLQMIRNHFVVVAMKYPASTKFTIKIQLDGATNYTVPSRSYTEVTQSTETLNAPSAFSCPTNPIGFCSNTGGVGPAYYFSGKFLYLRVVNPVYYTTGDYARTDWVMKYKGNRLGVVIRKNIYYIETTCNGCANSPKSALLWDVADELPPEFPGQLMSAPPTNYNGPAAVGSCGNNCPPPTGGNQVPNTGNGGNGGNGGNSGNGQGGSSGGSNTNIGLIVGIAAGAIFLGCVIGACLWMGRKRRQEKTNGYMLMEADGASYVQA